MLWEFGEETKSRSIAKKIVAAREEKQFETTLQLSYLLGGDKARVFTGRRASLHPATLTFQALRIAVNRELSVRGPSVLRPCIRENNAYIRTYIHTVHAYSACMHRCIAYVNMIKGGS